MAHWCPPIFDAGKYIVEYVGYPETRSIEEYIFETEQEAISFFNLQTSPTQQGE